MMQRTNLSPGKWVLAVLLLGLLSMHNSRADAPENYPFLRYDEGLRLAQRDGKPVFVYYGRYGCGFCEKTNKQSFSDAEVRKRYTDHYVLVYLDAESGRRLQLPSGETITEMELGARLKTLVTPNFLFLQPDGQVIYRAVGFQTAQAFLEYDRFIHGGHYKTQSFAQFQGK